MRRKSVPELLERQRAKVKESMIRFAQRIQQEAEDPTVRFGESAYRDAIKGKTTLSRKVLPAVAKVLSIPVEQLERYPLKRRPSAAA